MAFFSGLRGFRIPSHRQFDYRPVFYDERKEKLSAKIKKQEELDIKIESGEYTPNVKGKIKEYYNKSPRRKQVRSSNIRLVIFIVVLSFGAYYFLNNEISALLGF